MFNFNERQLLPIIRDAVTGHELAKKSFQDALSPLFEQFLASGLEKEEYNGWSFNLLFVNAAKSDCRPFLSTDSSPDSTWEFFPKGKDDCTYVVPGKGEIKIHLHSFLWR